MNRKVILKTLLYAAVLYLFGAFVAGTFDSTLWHFFGKVILLVIFLIGYIFIWAFND